MIVELGAFALCLCFALSVAQTGLSAIAAGKRSMLYARAGETAAICAFVTGCLAFAALIYAFVVSDFSLQNVASNSHTHKPMIYKVSAAWGSHEGSILLWCLMLTGYGSAAALFGGGLPQRLKALVLAVQGALGVLFLAYTILASNPLARLAQAPAEGRSLNPLLQDPAVAIHPPVLYAGYVGFSIVFSFAVAALIEGKIDTAWARWVRPWTLAAWSLLTVGITLGAIWAYYELGWGGWWAWDPVENVSFMPWLIGAALLHSAIVTEKRNALPGWTMFLALMGFIFALLGGFLVRSGVLTSVHSFAVDPERGVLLLSILGLTAGSALALFAWRAPLLKPGGVFAPVSRESGMVLNNIVLTAATGTVLLGTLYPLIREAMGGETVSVGPPYFNLTFTPLMAIALAVIPLGPLLSWKRGDLPGVMQRLWAAAAIAVGAGLLGLLLVSPRNALACLGLTAGAWLIAGALTEMIERIRLFRVPFGEAMKRLAGLPRSAFGVTLAHAGLGVFVLGATFETTWRVETAEALSLGGRMDLGAYSVTLEAVSSVDGPNYLAERGRVVVRSPAGAVLCDGLPERRLFPTGGQTTTETAICARGLDHIYLVMGERRMGAEGQPAWLVSAYFNPWIRLVFLGPMLMALGGLISLTDRRLRLAAPRRGQRK
jgi:cytochrome c-type biogenesis protein CcmF